MRVVVQRVKYASVKVNEKIVGKIDHGYLLLVGFGVDDTMDVVEKMAKKVHGLRIFDDEQGKMNLSIEQVSGAILSISQFTLYADSAKGNRPSFIGAIRPETATKMYDEFNRILRQYGLVVEEGIFGADMKVELLNDGPVTIILDSKEMNL